MTVDVVFRVDASRVIGSGHLMRCLTLGRRLAEEGATVTFLTRAGAGDLGDLVEREGFALARLQALGAVGTGCASFPECPALDDADECLMLLASRDLTPDLLIVDHYGLGRTWESRLRAQSRRMMVIDDLAARAHDCDILLDQNVFAEAARYKDLVSESATLLLGPRYALLQPEYARLHEMVRPRSTPVRRVLVYFGASDPGSLTVTALRALLSLSSRLTIDVVLPDYLPGGRAAVDALRSPNIRIHERLRSLAPLLATADVAIGACGTTAWERCCLGVPAVVAAVAVNQHRTATELHNRGIVIVAGYGTHVDEGSFASAIEKLLVGETLAKASQRGMELVDGHGTARVVHALLGSGRIHEELFIRPVSRADAVRLREWRNDLATVRASHSAAPVEWDEHVAWLEASLSDPERRIYIAERYGEPVGTVRVDLRPDGQELSWTVAPTARGKGIGKAMVRRVAEVLVGAVYAEIRSGNSASMAIAEAAGFTVVGERDGVLRYERRNPGQ